MGGDLVSKIFDGGEFYRKNCMGKNRYSLTDWLS